MAKRSKKEAAGGAAKKPKPGPVPRARRGEEPTGPNVYVIGHGGPTLLDLRLDASEVRILLNGPGMLVGKLRLLTSVDASAGATHANLAALAGELRCVALCGYTGPVEIPVEVLTSRLGTRLEIGVGPTGMYQTELVLQTRSGEALGKAIARTLTLGKELGSYLVALEPLAAEGHPEHHWHAHHPVIGEAPAGPAGTGTPPHHGP
jgi:hypothetical protein